MNFKIKTIYYHSYFFRLLVWTTLLLLTVYIFNRLVDPLDLFDSPRISNFNSLKPGIGSNSRVWKMNKWKKNSTNNIILGTSRADIGLDPSHPGFSSQAFNMGLSAQPIIESKRILEWAVQRQKIQQVVLATDFFSANLLRGFPADFDDSNFDDSPNHHKKMISLDTTVMSLETILEQSENLIKEQGIAWNNYGLRTWHNNQNVVLGGHRKRFVASEKLYIEKTYFPPPSRQFKLSSNEKNSLKIYQDIISLAHEKNIELFLIFSPSHARQWHVIYALGLWPMWEKWKFEIVRINEVEAKRHGKEPFPIWDFSGFNSVTTETIPPINDSESQMQWYWESSHYKRELGDLVLDRVFNYNNLSRNVPDDFGVLLSLDNIESHLSKVRSDYGIWKIAFFQYVDEINRIILKTNWIQQRALQ